MKMKQGASVGIFSPSYIMVGEAPQAAQRAEDFLRENGFRVIHGKLWGRQNAYRTGTPQERADEFNSLLRDPAVDLLMASVGGFVTNGMLPYIDYEFFAANPKPVVGMSDVTALLLALYAKTGIPTYYGTNFVTRETLIKSGAQDAQSDFSSDCMKTTPLGWRMFASRLRAKPSGGI